MNRRRCQKCLRIFYKTRLILDPQLVCIFKTSISQKAESIKFYAVFITSRNEVGARLCFYTCLWFCSQKEGRGHSSMHCKWYPSMPCPHPGGKLRGLAWGGLQVPTKGGLQAHTRWGVSRQTPQRLLLRAVCILLECILVLILFAKVCAMIEKFHCFSKRKLNLKND